MTKTQKFIMGGLAVLAAVLALALWIVWRASAVSSVPSSQVAFGETASALRQGAPGAASGVTSGAAVDKRAPNAIGAAPSAPIRYSPVMMSPEKMARLEVLKGKFEKLSASPNPDMEEADALLGELIEIQGTSVIAGVDFAVMRQILRMSNDLQKLANEVKAESEKPRPDQEKMKRLTRKMQDLQGQLQARLTGVPGVPGASFSQGR
jgi:hypothetical protein